MSRKNSGGANRASQTKQPGISPLLIGGIVLVVIAVLIFGWIAFSPNRGSAGTPQIKVSTERLELGKQVFDRPVRASFTVTNTGNGTLMLDVPRIATVLEGC